MNKNGVQQSDPLVQKVKFAKEFTEQIQNYIKNTQQPTVQGFAETLHVTVDTLWAWANKQKKDEQGNLTDQLARPQFNAELKKLQEIESKPSKEVVEKLNPKQEAFAKLYTTASEFFGNGVQTYIEVYEPDQTKPNWYKNACSSASEILSNPKVFNRINELLEDQGLNDANVDKQTAFLINQYADFSAKLGAIKEYNKLKKRITQKLDVTSDGKPILGGLTNVSSNDSN